MTLESLALGKKMGEIFQQAKIRNIVDIISVKTGNLSENQVVELDVDFLVDTGATLVGLPINIIEQLGLVEVGTREFLMGNGEATRCIFNPIRIRVMDREADVTVMEILPEMPPIMGYVSLELLDLCANPQEGILEGNPRHGGRMLLKLL